MNVRIHSDLAIAFSTTFYSVFKHEIYPWVKSVEYMTFAEFKGKYKKNNFVEFSFGNQHIRITFNCTGNTIYLDFISVL